MSLISSLSILIPLLIGLVCFRTLDKLQKWFLGFIVLSALFEIVVSYTGRHGIHNVWLFKVFLFVDFVFFIWFVNKVTKYSRWQWIFVALVVFFVFFSEFYIKRNEPFNSNNSLLFVSFFLFFIIQSSQMIIFTFDDFDTDIRKNYVFWIAFARLFYFLIIVFIYIYPNFIENGYKITFLNKTNTTINMFANVLLNLIYGISFLCHRKEI